MKNRKNRRELLDTSVWCHASTSINPADLISRGCLIPELSGSKFLFDGPKFLWGNFDFESIGVEKRLNCPACSVDALLGSDEVCLLLFKRRVKQI